ncbi:MAG TPA: NPCBM/NEW2 domain-containing protein [Tepidisphaeraceae bacterium]|nr:NPCBM/NEW2 domain-containing protein [Tepidisphaeraceae bacterium]
MITPTPAPPDTNSKTPAQPRLAVPDTADQAQSRKLFKQAFSGELKDHSPTGRRTLAAKLLTEADKVADNPCDRFVLLVGACDAAAEGGDLRLAGRAAETAATLYEVDAAHLSANAALKSPLKISTPEQASEAVDGGLELESTLVRAGDYSTAARLLAALEPMAVRDPRLGPLLKERTAQLAEIRLAHDRAEAAADRLKKAPDDPGANSAVGEFLCFYIGDFEHGLPPLIRGDDAAMRSAAKRDVDGAADSKQQIAIGDGWWELAEKRTTREAFKAAMRGRAKVWYIQAIASGHVTGLARTTLEKRIATDAAGREYVYLSSLKESRVDGIYTDNKYGLAKDSMNPGSKKPVSVGGVDYAHALGLNPNGSATARVDYDLGGRFRRFTGAVGVNDSSDGLSSTLTFKILADGKEMWRSKPLRETKVSEKFDVSVFNVKTLELQIENVGPAYGAHCVWIEPRLEAR